VAHRARERTAGSASRNLLIAAAVAALTAGVAGRARTEPASSPTAGVWLWSPNPLVAVFKEADTSDAAETSPIIRLVATRNGACSGQVVVCSREPAQITGATASDLDGTAAGARIPAAAVQVRYALPTGTDRYARKRFPGVRQPSRFDALAATPGPAGTVQPVWITVSVPPEAKPGQYRGRLHVRLGDGTSLAVPIRLDVSAWRLPDAQGFATHLGFIQSPSSVAIQYGVPLWSKAHFDLIARSFHYLGQLGNRTLYIPLLAQTHFGNAEGMVRWIRRPDGTFDHDFSVFERYLDLYRTHAVKPDMVCLYVWDYSIGGSWWGDPKKTMTPQPVPVTRLDPSTGTTEVMHGPAHGAPGSTEFWRPVLAGIRERLARRGFRDENILLGIGGDKRPDRATVEMFTRIAPFAKWVSNSHGRLLTICDAPVGYVAHVWGVSVVPPPETKRQYGWRRPLLVTCFPRYGGGKYLIHPNLSLHAPLPVYRNICEGATLANLRGLGRLGADFWPVLHGRRRKVTILNRYPAAKWGQLSVSTAIADILYPGPEGALATVRFEMLREGLQEAEARIFIERALTTADLRAKLGDDLAGRTQDFLDKRTRTYLRAHGNLKTAAETNDWFAHSNWQDRTAQLFNAAADVQRILDAD